MVGNQYIRDYEVSVWTLQDSFITVLKQSKLENREKIQEPKMILKDDGENTFSFKIPMYLQEDNDLTETPYFKEEIIWKENPIWYTTRNGNIIANMRKVKIIFNKKTNDEEVFEFIINKVTEEHEGYSKYCNVECSGLAFHELGKQGYEISLSADDFFAEYEDWLKGISENQPINNINYWVDKILANTSWHYLIYMDWAAYDGIVDNGLIMVNDNTVPYLQATQQQRDDYNAARETNGLRRKDVIYRDPYVSSWTKDNTGALVAASSVTDLSKLEKLETIESNNSNRYNLLQSVAEAFGVFCKFQYLYDDNYHIIDRQVIFYNNFINENSGFIDFTYGYNTTQLTREMDSTDLISKMFVSSLKDTGTLKGEISISDSLANPSLENYILNFDYLNQIETISKEQYDQIKFFQSSLREINQNLLTLNANLNAVEQQIPEEEARRDAAKDLAEEAAHTAATARASLDTIGNGKTPEFTTTNPLSLTIIHSSSNRYYANIYNAYSGLFVNTFTLYTNKNCTTQIPNSYLQFERDSNNLITKVLFPASGSGYSIPNSQMQVFATFKFEPQAPGKIVEQIWGAKENQARLDMEEAEDTLSRLNEQKEAWETQLQTLIQTKKELKANFEKLMGPALREGTWQPEDKYADYQIHGQYPLNTNNLSLLSIKSDSNDVASFSWTPKVFREEESLTYHYDINTDRYYPCIDLRGINDLNSLNIQNLNLVYRDIYLDQDDNVSSSHDPRTNHYLQVGASNGCEFAFIQLKSNIQSEGEIIPVLVVKGVESVLDAVKDSVTYTAEEQLKLDARLSQITYDNGQLIETEIETSLTWINMQDIINYQIVYPRFRVTTTNFLTTTPESMIKRGTDFLIANTDYYLLYKEYNNKFGYFITLKPESVIFNLNDVYTVNYALSTTADAVYLDAVAILKENSMPKVSYSIKPLAIDSSFIHIAYAQLGQLIHINDYELKFENVQGYISEVELDLDRPQEDVYTVKNYKTKFEDIFSSIVAQTSNMQKNSQTFAMTASLLNNDGTIDPELLSTSLLNAHIDKIIDGYIPSELQLVAAQNTANLAASTAYKIMNGEIGLAFPATNMIESIQLNTDVGLLIEGKQNNTSVYFRATNANMGFFRKIGTQAEESLLYFDNGDLAIKGTMMAQTGWFGGENGWIISSGETVNSQNYPGGLFYSANEKAIFYAGDATNTPKIKLYDNSNVNIFSFESGNLSITGTVYATTGRIGGTYNTSNNTWSGGWVIKSGAIYSGTDSKSSTTAGLYLGTDAIRAYSSSTQYTQIENGKITAVSADLSGKITATSGAIGGWSIDNDSIFTGTKTDASSIRLSSANFTRTINSVSRANLRIAVGSNFGISNTGALYATGATISGALTATSLIVGNTSTMSYDSINGLVIGSGNNKISYKNSNLEIKCNLISLSSSNGNSNLSIDATQIIMNTAGVVQISGDSNSNNFLRFGLSNNEYGVAIDNNSIDAAIGYFDKIYVNGAEFVGSNKRIIFQSSEPSWVHDVLWIKPGNPSTTTGGSVTFTMPSFGSRRQFEKSSYAVQLNNFTKSAGTLSGTITGSISIPLYAWKSGTNQVKDVTVSYGELRWNNVKIMDLQIPSGGSITIAGGQEVPLNFSGTVTSEFANSNTISGLSVYLVSNIGSGYVNIALQKNKTYILTCTEANVSTSSARLCTVYYIP